MNIRGRKRERERKRQTDRQAQTERQTEQVSWCFTPIQPLRLYQGDDRQSQRQTDRERERERGRERGGEGEGDVQGRFAEDMLRPSGWSGRISLSQRWERERKKEKTKRKNEREGKHNANSLLGKLMYYIYSQSLQNN